MRYKLDLYIQLTRLNRPIGVYLLLWPTWWALWLANQGMPNLSTFIIFTLGVVLMRSAGCVINDIADRKVDKFVERTQHRPITSGKVSTKEALVLFFVLCALSFILVLFTNLLTIMLSFVAVFLAALYPFMKRIMPIPQAVLGAAFSWAIPMAYAASNAPITGDVWLLYAATVCWIIAYDTQYAMTDLVDDVKIGIKSSAILFARFALPAVLLLQCAFLICLNIFAYLSALGSGFYAVNVLLIALFAYQYRHILKGHRNAGFEAFLQNHYIGLLVFVAIVLGLVQQTYAL